DAYLAQCPHAPQPPSDVFSLGVLLWEMLYGERPFRDDKSMTKEARVVARRGRPDRPSGTGPWRRIHELAHECLAPDPEERPSAASVAAQLTHWQNPHLHRYLVRASRGVHGVFLRFPAFATLPIAITSSA